MCWASFGESMLHKTKVISAGSGGRIELKMWWVSCITDQSSVLNLYLRAEFHYFVGLNSHTGKCISHCHVFFKFILHISVFTNQIYFKSIFLFFYWAVQSFCFCLYTSLSRWCVLSTDALLSKAFNDTSFQGYNFVSALLVLLGLIKVSSAWMKIVKV